MSSPRIAIIVYTLYGHIAKMAEAVKTGIEASGGKATIYQVPETLSEDILKILHAPAKPDYPIATLETLTGHDGFVFGVPTRYGSMPTQWKSFLDGTGALWAKSSLAGKYATIITSTGTGGGTELTPLSMMSTLVHHGINFVPLGYSKTFALMGNPDEVKGASAWGAGCLAGPTGARQPSPLEIKIAEAQGQLFYNTLARVDFSKPI